MDKKKSILENGRDFQSLSIQDLLEARDAYHVFLTRKKNVVGTAIGKYRRRLNIKDKGPKTLENTETYKYSWPCILVFVEEWIKLNKFGGNNQLSYDDYIPQRLFMPDGKEIPVCVIEAKWMSRSSETIKASKFRQGLLGGGYPIITRVQEEEKVATLGCLVSDGRLTYGLTNTHVTGNPGEILYSLQNGEEIEFGKSSSKQLSKEVFSNIYEGFAGKHMLINLDVGLIEITDNQNVTSQVFGIGEIKGIADINHDTLSLNLIGCPLKGYGCASGVMKGEIVGLFYRYKSSGGYDIVTDYLVGPRKIKGRKLPFSPLNGDSGTLMIIDDKNSLENNKAIGILWGGQKAVTGNRYQPYGLVTNIGTICRKLDVELVCDWNTGYDNYFGAYAHCTLPLQSIKMIKDNDLMELMKNNQDRIGYPLESTVAKQTEGLSNAPFIPLADIPDLMWKKRGGEYLRGKEGSNHFADMDQISPIENKTLFKLCEDEDYVHPKRWLKFYESVKATEKGALPFRIAQIFDAMVNSKNNVEFVCAAGILTHYIFDACMPLHISYMHHGNPTGPKKIIQGKKVPKAYDVHAEFDKQMVEYHIAALRKNLPVLIKKDTVKDNIPNTEKIKSSKDAAIASVKLMSHTVTYSPPEDIVKEFEKLVDLKKRERIEKLWKKYGSKLMLAIAEAVVLTARLWDAAWEMRVTKDLKTDTINEESLMNLCKDEDFLKSVNLKEMETILNWN